MGGSPRNGVWMGGPRKDRTLRPHGRPRCVQSVSAHPRDRGNGAADASRAADRRERAVRDGTRDRGPSPGGPADGDAAGRDRGLGRGEWTLRHRHGQGRPARPFRILSIPDHGRGVHVHDPPELRLERDGVHSGAEWHDSIHALGPAASPGTHSAGPALHSAHGVPPGPEDTLRSSWSANGGTGPPISFNIPPHPANSTNTSLNYSTTYYNAIADRVDDSWVVGGAGPYMIFW